MPETTRKSRCSDEAYFLRHQPFPPGSISPTPFRAIYEKAEARPECSDHLVVVCESAGSFILRA